jgi:hypothetical protein
MKTTKLALSLYALALMVCTFTVAQDEAAPRATLTAPKIVASGVFQHQSAAIPVTNIFTASGDGLYRISVYISITNQQPPNSAWFARIESIDASADTPTGVDAFTIPGDMFASEIVSPRPGMPITLAVQPLRANIVPSVGFYTVRYVIEQLQ